ncbi:MAG: LysM peptidoglycan-binding domain-containing protein [Pseudomonadota bacterium]
MAVRKTSGSSAPQRPSGEQTIQVQKGDTLSGIARRHGVTLQQLLAANPGITDPDRIRTGQRLELPRASTAPSTSPVPRVRPETTSGVDASTTPQRRTLGRDPATVQPELNTTGSLRGNGALGLLSAKKNLDSDSRTAASPAPNTPSSWNPFDQVDNKLVDSLQDLSPAKLRGVDGLQLVGAVKDGDLQVEIPLKAGRYKARGVSFSIEPNTVMRVQMQVRDGELVPARDARGRDTGGGCKVEIDPPADLPLWLTGRGAYLRDRGEAQVQFKADIGGFFDLNISKRGRFEVKDLVSGFADGSSTQATPASARGSRSDRSETPPMPEGVLQLDRLRFNVGQVTLKDDMIDAGSARIDLASGSHLRLSGDASRATLEGRVRVDSVALNQDGQALKTGPGEATVHVSSATRRDGSVVLSTRLSNVQATLEGFEATRPGTGEGAQDRLSLGPTKIRDGEVEVETTLRPGAPGRSSQVESGKVRASFEAEGVLRGLQLTVPDARGNTSFAVGESPFAGRVAVGPEGTRVDVTLADSRVEVRDLQTTKRDAALDLHHLQVQGRTALRLDTGSDDYKVDVQGRQIAVRVDDYRGHSAGVDVDLARTELTGQGRVQLGRDSGVQIDGELQLQGGVDDLQVRRSDGSLGLDLAAGSRVDAAVTHFSAGGGRGFEMDARGEVDIGLEHYKTRLPGLEAEGSARLQGTTDLHIGQGQIFFTRADATVEVQVDDAKVAPGGQGFSLDAGQGSQLDLKVQELKVSSNPAENSVVLGQGSRLQAVLDGGQMTLGGRTIALEKGSQARFDIDSVHKDGQGLPELHGTLQVDARFTGDLEATSRAAGSGARIERIEGSRSRARITVDDVALGQDGRFHLKGVGVQVDGGIDRIAGATGADGRGRGSLSDSPGEPLEPLVLPQAATAPPTSESSPQGTLSAERVRALSAAAIAGATVPGQDFHPVDVAKRIQDGTIEMQIPVEGTLGSGWRKSADFKKGTTLTVQATVENGRVVPGKTKASFSQSGDGPLWVTVRGAYFDDKNTLRLDLGGMKDFAVPGMEKMPLEADRFVERMTGQTTPSGSRSTSTNSAGNAGGATTSVPAALKLDQASLSVDNAVFKPGPLPVPGGTIQVDRDTRLTMSGTASAASLSGRIRFSEVELAQDGVALQSGKGSADLRVDYRRDGDRATITTSLENMSLDVRYAVHKRTNGDYIHLADGQVEGANLRTTTKLRLGPDGLPVAVDAADVNLHVPHFAGRIEGARATVDDADGEAQVEFGRSAVVGEIRVDHNRIAIKGQVDQLDAAVRDFAVASGQGKVDVQYARLRGKGEVDFAQGRGLQIDAEVQDIDARIRDFQSEGRGMAIDAGRTSIQGKGRVRLHSQGEVLLDGDLHIDSTLDRLSFAGETVGAKGRVETTSGSRLVADVNRVRFTREGEFSIQGKGGVDLGIRDFAGEVPGVQVEGSARIRGGGAFEFDSREGVHLPDRLQIDVDVRDGALRSSDGTANLDLAAGTRVSLNVTDMRVSERGRATQLTLGPGTTVHGGLDAGQLRVPGLSQPLVLGTGSQVEFSVDDLVVDEQGARRAQGRLRLEAELQADQVNLEELSGIRGLHVQRLDRARIRLTVDVPRAQLHSDGRFELEGTSFALDARMGSVSGRYDPGE